MPKAFADSCPRCHTDLQQNWNLCPFCAWIINPAGCLHRAGNSRRNDHGDPLEAALSGSQALRRFEVPAEIREALIEPRSVFYEQLTARTGFSSYTLCLAVGLCFFGLHSLTAFYCRENIFLDWSWMLSVMIFAAQMLVSIATAKLRIFVCSLFSILNTSPETFLATYGKLLGRILSNRFLGGFGLCFGTINVCFGLYYGVWYQHPLIYASLVLQFFVVGFVCGMGLGGIAGIILIISRLNRDRKLNLDLDAPDRCAGTSFVGKALVQFSLITLMMGLLIAGYIYATWWDSSLPIMKKISIAAWMAFPYIASLGLILLPVIDLHRRLKAFKKQWSRQLAEQITLVRMQLFVSEENLQLEEDIQPLTNYYDHLVRSRENLSLMAAWPYNQESRIIFILVYSFSLIYPISRAVSFTSMVIKWFE